MNVKMEFTLKNGTKKIVGESYKIRAKASELIQTYQHTNLSHMSIVCAVHNRPTTQQQSTNQPTNPPQPTFILFIPPDLPYTADSMKNCKKIIINKCEQYMWLDDLTSDKQDKVIT